MAAGDEKVSVCQPEALSPLNVPEASGGPPVAAHSAPTCVPVLAAALWKRTPVTEPATSDVNFTPSTAESASPESAVEGAASSNSDALGLTAFEAADAVPLPAELVAAIRNVYVVPFVSPVIRVLVVAAPTVVTGSGLAPAYGVTR